MLNTLLYIYVLRYYVISVSLRFIICEIISPRLNSNSRFEIDTRERARARAYTRRIIFLRPIRLHA